MSGAGRSAAGADPATGTGGTGTTGTAGAVPAATGPSPDAVAAVVSALPGVHLDPATVAGTYLPGRRVPGVRVRDEGVEVHVAVTWPRDVRTAAEEVRVAVLALGGGPVDVVVSDVLAPGEEPVPPTAPVTTGVAAPAAAPGPLDAPAPAAARPAPPAPLVREDTQ